MHPSSSEAAEPERVSTRDDRSMRILEETVAIVALAVAVILTLAR